MKAILTASAFFVVVALTSFRSFISNPDINAKTKTLFIYNFIKYVEWPDQMKAGTFIIGFYGDYPDLYAELEKMASTKTAGSQKMTLVKFSSLEAVNECHLIYINEDKAGELPAIVKKLGEFPTLIVTDDEGAAQKGACINFYYEESKQRMEVNPDNIKKRELKISGQLLSLSKVVQ